MKTNLKENIIKNIILFIALIIAYFYIENVFMVLKNTDPVLLGNLLVAVSMLSVIACFGAFGFTYEKVDDRSLSNRFFAHIATGVLMFVIGLTLEMTSVLITYLLGYFFIINFSIFLVYFGVVLYDFWDLKRADLPH